MNYFLSQILLLSVSLTKANRRKTVTGLRKADLVHSRSWLLRAEVRGRATHPEWLHGEPPLSFLTKSIQLKYTYCPLGHISSVSQPPLYSHTSASLFQVVVFMLPGCSSLYYVISCIFVYQLASCNLTYPFPCFPFLKFSSIRWLNHIYFFHKKYFFSFKFMKISPKWPRELHCLLEEEELRYWSEKSTHDHQYY